MNLIIDGNHAAHRAKHTHSLSNHGIDVSTSYGVLHMLSSWLMKWKPTTCIVCWDGGVPEFRRQTVVEYKANRTIEDPDEYEDFKRQMRELSEVMRFMGIVSIRHYGAEGDDLIYHASRMLDGDSVIISSDSDLLQCVNDSVSVYHPSRDKIYSISNIESELGIPYTRIVDWKALQGDGSDNIPGIAGIGEKTATKLLQQFGDVSGVYNAAMDKNPKGKIQQDKLRLSIIDFGWNRIVKNIKVMALYADRVGARQAIADAVGQWKPADSKRINRYFQSQAFVSLMDGNFINRVNKLQAPELIGEWRYPKVLRKRIPA